MVCCPFYLSSLKAQVLLASLSPHVSLPNPADVLHASQTSLQWYINFSPAWNFISRFNPDANVLKADLDLEARWFIVPWSSGLIDQCGGSLNPAMLLPTYLCTFLLYDHFASARLIIMVDIIRLSHVWLLLSPFRKSWFTDHYSQACECF